MVYVYTCTMYTVVRMYVYDVICCNNRWPDDPPLLLLLPSCTHTTAMHVGPPHSQFVQLPDAREADTASGLTPAMCAHVPLCTVVCRHC